jgi:hypothetical protein
LPLLATGFCVGAVLWAEAALNPLEFRLLLWWPEATPMLRGFKAFTFTASSSRRVGSSGRSRSPWCSARSFCCRSARWRASGSEQRLAALSSPFVCVVALHRCVGIL